MQSLILKVSQVNMRRGYGLKVCRELLIELALTTFSVAIKSELFIFNCIKSALFVFNEH